MSQLDASSCSCAGAPSASAKDEDDVAFHAGPRTARGRMNASMQGFADTEDKLLRVNVPRKQFQHAARKNNSGMGLH